MGVSAYIPAFTRLECTGPLPAPPPQPPFAIRRPPARANAPPAGARLAPARRPAARPRLPRLGAGRRRGLRFGARPRRRPPAPRDPPRLQGRGARRPRGGGRLNLGAPRRGGARGVRRPRCPAPPAAPAACPPRLAHPPSLYTVCPRAGAVSCPPPLPPLLPPRPLCRLPTRARPAAANALCRTTRARAHGRHGARPDPGALSR
ncbi:MAG: hypothetical protein J3K34DRAFT_77139 [Monoraphidium minutum]|nr:MAG: hypothetical protein J3K34DRAFT_77139 [Monoraphidium minutum]